MGDGSLKAIQGLPARLREVVSRMNPLKSALVDGFPTACADVRPLQDITTIESAAAALDRVQVWRFMQPLNPHQAAVCQRDREVPSGARFEVAEAIGRQLLENGSLVLTWGKLSGGQVVAKGEISVLRPAGDKHIFSEQLQAAEDAALERAAEILDRREAHATRRAVEQPLSDRAKPWSDVAQGYRAAAAEIRDQKSDANVKRKPI